MPKIAVIGAGISGLAAARTLVDHGFDVTVFDKGRGAGGRMATRRTETGFRFDHGAQYFSARDEHFRRYVESWCEAGVVQLWEGRIVELGGGQVVDRVDSQRFVGVPGMNAVCKHLSRDVRVQQGVKIDSMTRRDGWQLVSEGQVVGEFDGVLIAIPPVQAEQLLGEVPSLANQVSQIQMTPCWAAMFAFSDRIPLNADGAFVKNSSISWVARNSSKPSREGDDDCWVVHASADWSVEHLERSAEAVVELMLPEFFAAIGTEPQRPLHAVAHRWRYAIPATPLEAGFLHDAEANVTVCGDWCLGSRVEAAFLSGMAAAGCMQRHSFGPRL